MEDVGTGQWMREEKWSSIYRTVYQSDGNEMYLLDMIKEGQQAGRWLHHAG